MNKPIKRWLGLVACASLLLAGCSTPETPSPSESGTPAASASAKPSATPAPTGTPTKEDPQVDPDGSFVAAIGEPQSLLPPNAAEAHSIETLSALFTPLTNISPEKKIIWGDDEPDAVAKTVDISDDGTIYTITLKDGWTFHNGDAITAKSYVDAWNYTANPKNAMAGLYMFEPIKGSKELADGKATTLSGVEAVDDKTIKVTLTKPFSPFLGMLTYAFFLPLPEAFYKDTKAFGESPIGNGPFKMDGEWHHDEYIKLVRNDDYPGNTAKAAAVELRIYADIATSYNAVLAGDLDVVDDIPRDLLPKANEQLEGRMFTGPSASFTYIGFPMYAKAFQKPELRQALSLAIDRQTIVDSITNGAFIPADDFIAPSVEGYAKGKCEFCQYDVAKAKELYDKAGGIKGPIEVWYFTGWGDEEWVEAVANYWKKNLGIQDVTFKALQLADFLDAVGKHEHQGPYRLGWTMDYPSAQSYLSIWQKGTSANNAGYDNPAFDKLVLDGAAAPDTATANELFAKASDILKSEMPAVPMFFGNRFGAYSPHVRGLVVSDMGQMNLSDIEVLKD